MISRKHFYTCGFALLLFVAGAADYASAQTTTVRYPRPSQKSSVMQTIGVTDIIITYHRPGVKGRVIWGDALPSQAETKARLRSTTKTFARRARPSFPGVMSGAPERTRPPSSRSAMTS